MHRILVLLALSASLSAAQTPASPAPLRVCIRAGPKTHGEGQHDHPRFLAEWPKLLMERGCAVTGSLEFPGEAELGASDVLVIYAADGASIHGEERARLERFLARGGGLVVLHDGVCGDDPQWFKTVAGGAWENGHSKYLEGDMGLCFADHEHPITKGVANFDFKDEIYWDLHLDPGAHVLANSFHTPFDITPQMWTFEKDGYRAFVSIQGHEWTSFSNPAWRTLLLRGIAWAGKRDVDLLTTKEEVAGLRYPPGGPLAPEKAAASFVLHPDFKIELVAAEPLVVNPVSLDWDERGRMWVALTPGYPDKQEFSGVPAHDSVVILADKDGDGRMDERKVFADGLDLVTSLVFHEDGVIVTQAPDILWLRDTDHDDQADQRVVLYHGFGYGDTHAVMSNLRWGRDGWIYATQGYSGNASRHVTGKDGKDHGLIGNGLFRFEPDGSAIEMVSSYGSNTWGLDFSWDDELFFSMANGSHLRHVVLGDPELAAGRIGSVESWLDVTDHDRAFPLRAHERAPYQQIDFVGGFTAAAGCCLYTGGAWPKDFDGDGFVCEPTINLVHHDSLAPKGISYLASKAREPEFLASTDLWFRPVHLRVGPDGALYLLDFYNQAAVHNDTRGPQHGPTNAAVRPDRDHEHGRIWRIQHRAAKPVFAPALAGAPELELVAALAHPNAWERLTAQRLLCAKEKLEPRTLDALSSAALNGASSANKVDALWTLARKAPDKLAALAGGSLREPDPAVRKNLLLALACLDGWQLAHALPQPAFLLDETDPRARLSALVLLKRVMPDAGYPKLLAHTLALDDDWSRSAVLGIAAEHPARFVEACCAARPSSAIDVLVRALCAGIVRRADLKQAVEVVTALGERGPDTPGLGVAALEELGRGLDAAGAPWSSPRLDEALVHLLSKRSVEVGIAALPLCARWSQSPNVAQARDKLGAQLAELVGDEQREPALRLSALSAMLSLPAQRKAAIEAAGALLDPLFPLEFQLGVIDALAPLGEAAPALCASFERLSQPARERVLATLFARPASTGALLDALSDKTIKATELGPQGLHRLRNHPDAATAARAAKVLDQLGQGERTDKDALITELAAEVERPGDAAHGRELFALNCGNCHTVKGVETRGGVGPDLTGMGTHGARELLPFLLDPNRAVEPAFLEYVVETTDGKLVDGVIKRESAASIVLRNSSGESEIPRDHIKELRSTGRSPMPTGLETLGAGGLRDVISFLAGGWSGFRVLDLRALCSSSATRGLYDTQHDAKPMRFKQYGVVDVEGVPFEILDPARMGEEKNTLTLKGGMAAGWESHSYPQKVELAVGTKVFRLHVLGGIAAWGFPYTQQKTPAVKLTWKYADGQSEEKLLVDGTEFGDWIGRNEVPGSKWVDVLAGDSWGQVRTFAVAPARTDAVVSSIVLESFDNHLAPTFVALTVQLDGTTSAKEEPMPMPMPMKVQPKPEVLIFGGGSSHDFGRWFGATDVQTLGALGKIVGYSEAPDELARALDSLEVLVLCTNQPLADAKLRQGLFAFVARGGGLVLVHPATWYNWADWPEYNRELVGGGTRSHENYAEFAVKISADHPVTKGVPPSFTVADELYRFEPDAGAKSEVLAFGRSLTSGKEYPVLWTRTSGKGRIVGFTLGHDGAAHEGEAYKKLLANAVRWVDQR